MTNFPDPNSNALILQGVVVKGHRVATGPSMDYPYCSLERQLPFFLAGGLDLTAFHLATLNISIAPLRFILEKPAYTFRQIAWTELHPPEDFSFSPCCVNLPGTPEWFEGYVYYPHPETKIRNFHNPSLLEVITVKIPDIGYGTQLQVALDPQAVRISRNPIP
jgi:hypothetical protein